MANRIIGVTGVDILAGLHWYLKNWCGSHISWDKTGGAQLFSLPKVGLLPRVHDAGVLVQRPIPWSYYQNAVTSSCKLLFPNCNDICETKAIGKLFVLSVASDFWVCLINLDSFLFWLDSFSWWDWKRWEKEIDWMALQGINLPLAFTGQEAIWQKVFQVIGIEPIHSLHLQSFRVKLYAEPKWP